MDELQSYSGNGEMSTDFVFVAGFSLGNVYNIHIRCINLKNKTIKTYCSFPRTRLDFYQYMTTVKIHETSHINDNRHYIVKISLYPINIQMPSLDWSVLGP